MTPINQPPTDYHVAARNTHTINIWYKSPLMHPGLMACYLIYRRRFRSIAETAVRKQYPRTN